MIKLFFSYSHKDEELRNELEKHLTILKRNHIINTWHDRRIDAGADFGGSISANMQDADIILLLISSDFLSSDYCYDIEVKQALQLHAQKKAIVVPVILRPCDWQNSPFSHLLALPTDGKPVVKFQTYDEGFVSISKGLKSLITSLNKKAEPAVEKQMNFLTQNVMPRSSNLIISKTFSDHEKDTFLKGAFSYIINFFESSLTELKNRNPEIRFSTDKVDSKTFTASLYRDGQLKSECMIFFGSTISSKGINYSHQISSARNSLNESLNIKDDGQVLMLKLLGFSSFGSVEKSGLTYEGAAEYYWSLFIKRLQER